jgi:hypothetical protein
MATITVGGEEIRLEPFSARKAIRVIRTIEAIAKGVPDLLDEWGHFEQRYEASHATEMDRAAARSQFGPQPLMDEEPLIHEGEALSDAKGNVLVRRTPKLDAEGRPVMGPDPLGHMSEQDWEASGHKLRMPRSPDSYEKIANIFPKALDLAEEQTLRLLALLAMPNGELKQAMRSSEKINDILDERADKLLDAPAEDLLELVVTAGEMVEDQFVTRVKGLGERLPNGGRLFGLNLGSRTVTTEPESSSSSSEMKPISSTDSLPPTKDGDQDESSTEPLGVSSSPSAVA